MPTYLLHGFRWPRNGFTGVRVHAIVHNLEDCSVEYIQNEASKEALLSSFRKLYPTIMAQLEDSRTGKTLDFIEPYDPEDELGDSAVSSKYAFVADRVITMAAGSTKMTDATNQQELHHRQNSLQTPTTGRPKSSSSPGGPATVNATTTKSSPRSSSVPQRDPAALFLNIEDAMSTGPAVTPQAWEALAELRDKVAEGEKIGWWIVYNGDPERAFEDDDQGEGDESEDVKDTGSSTPTQAEQLNHHNVLGQPMPSLLPPELKDLRYEDEREKVSIPTTVPHPPPPPPPPLEKPTIPTDGRPMTRPKSSKSFSMPLKKKSSKANLPPPKNSDIPEPPKLKEISKKEGFRHKFFGRRSEKG
ncbi:hypothetical protein H2198_000964 [Neophaeococcomyces mojaviensis]|uniref:Uncharacterized protein n=1 Tax=Neophaeococcomyces mojaviensis TaxID=3383035 RepID=A0ACC3AIY4_9EURO|nr:hypothetical protein H2198_000964 [Knufia sp. JES_112]